ncbi:hypothetical protein [Pedococcus soli]
MTRSERLQELRVLLGDHSLPTAYERMVDNGDGTMTVVEVNEDGVTQHQAMWMPPFTDEENDA